MPATTGVKVRGLRELNRAIKQVEKDLRKELRDGLKDVAEPVRSTDEALASEKIRNIGPTWERMRVGVTTKMVYVAPKARRHGGSPRPNLAGLLMDKAMQPALDQHEGDVVNRIERMLDRVGDKNGF
jgi:hypothetical protein